MDVRWITAFIDRPDRTVRTVAEFWASVSASSLSEWRGHEHEFATLVPDDGSDPHLRVQRTTSGESGTHIDLHVADVASGSERCVRLGATFVAERDDYAVLASPGDLSFCLVPHEGEQRRQAPITLDATGLTTLVDQVSIDCDPALFDAEVAFWSAVTNWSPLAARATNFRPLDRPSNQPLRILLHRRAEPSGRTGCHLDVACDDREVAVAAHEARGASVVAVQEHWTVMSDPSGAPYCLTRRRPLTGNLP